MRGWSALFVLGFSVLGCADILGLNPGENSSIGGGGTATGGSVGGDATGGAGGAGGSGGAGGACVPNCDTRTCGPDGCGDVCGTSCSDGEVCDFFEGCGAPAAGQWIVVAAGSFNMGAPEEETGRFVGEQLHEVTLSRDFIILSTEVSQTDFEARMGYNPSFFSAVGGPVDRVHWSQAAAYGNALSNEAGIEACYDCMGDLDVVQCQVRTTFANIYECRGFRLPTEAEWELSARAGTTTATYVGELSSENTLCQLPNPTLEEIAWWCGNSSDVTQPVAQKNPNAWGLFDMLGNVLEICHDWHGAYAIGSVIDPTGPSSGTERVIRGGSGGLGAARSRAAYRGVAVPTFQNGFVGFRMARTVGP